MGSVKIFFKPLLKNILFVLAAVGGAEVLYSEVIFPGYEFLPFEIYNPILDMTKDRFLFRIIFCVWSLLVYLFVQFILSRHKWKNLIIANEKYKVLNFLKGALFGFIYMCIVLFVLVIFNFSQIIEIVAISKKTIISVFLQFVAIIVTAFFLELIFRATVLDNLKKHLNIHVANLMTSVIFASIFIFNLSDYYPTKQFAFSLFLGYIYYKYGFYVTFGFHFGWNYLETLFFSNDIFKINLERQPDFTPLTEESLVSFTLLAIGVLCFLFKLLKKGVRKRKKKSPS